MPRFSTSAIVLRKVDFGDYDIIVTFFSASRGKLSAIAKSAKRSVKRFSGALELFSELNIVCESRRRKGLPVLQEAGLIHPFSSIRTDIEKTGYASYWTEMINEWMEEGQNQRDIYHLYLYVLDALDKGERTAGALSILFQLRFLNLSGYAPNFRECAKCRKRLEELSESRFRFDLKTGGLICGRCSAGYSNALNLQMGTIKQLLWIENGPLEKIKRVRFTGQSLQEGLMLLEAFAPYHLGKIPRSLTFLQQIRKS